MFENCITVWKKNVPVSGKRTVLFRFAGYHHVYTWLVVGTDGELRFLSQWSKKVCPRERVNHEESWGTWMQNIDPITTLQARQWIKAILKYKDFNFENWFPLSLQWDKNALTRILEKRKN